MKPWSGSDVSPGRSESGSVWGTAQRQAGRWGVCLVEETGREIEGPMMRLEEPRNVDLVGMPCSRRREPPSWLQELLRPAAGSRP